MARVVLASTVANRFAGGQHEFDLPVISVRQLIRHFEAQFPGLGNEIENASAIAINGEIYQEAFLEKIAPDAEVFILPKIGAG